MGLVGESGCGKSTLVKAVLRLLPDNSRTTGQILLDGQDIVTMTPRRLRAIRWTKLAFISQSAQNALDPLYRVGDQIVESILAHQTTTRAKAWKRAEEVFDLVGLRHERLYDYPHQFSGGMRQRTVIAMALSLNAGMLLADEPTTALDPIMQDQVLDRIHRIQSTLRRTMLLVSHDIGVIAETCDTVAVMYAGQIVERGPTASVLHSPAHPYTMGLRTAFPKLDTKIEKLVSIPGTPPSLADPPPGCRFAPRCPFAAELCRTEPPPIVDIGEGQSAACHFAGSAVELRAKAAEPDTWRLAADREGVTTA